MGNGGDVLALARSVAVDGVFGVSQAAGQTASVSENIGDLSRGSGETSQSAREVEDIAGAATSHLAEVTTRIDRFLKDVAAA